MKNTVKIYVLMLLMLGSACAVAVSSLAQGIAPVSGETIVYKDPDGKWPDGSNGPVKRLEKAQSAPHTWVSSVDPIDERWI